LRRFPERLPLGLLGLHKINLLLASVGPGRVLMLSKPCPTSVWSISRLWVKGISVATDSRPKAV
jgi:hypothetical protein